MCKSNKRLRDGFSCGDHDLDLYLNNIAFQDQKRHLCKVFLGLSPDNELICFFTLSCGGLNGKLIPGGNRKPYNYDLPVVRIGRLGVGIHYQRQGFGGLLMAEILKRYLSIHQSVGTTALVVDAYAVAEGFYVHYDFQPLLQKHKQYVSLYKTTKDILQLLKTT